MGACYICKKKFDETKNELRFILRKLSDCEKQFFKDEKIVQSTQSDFIINSSPRRN
jgi:hypothetical protein